ncbi:heme peroxidase, partial [Thozetella sp. PMI_491]
MIGDLLSLKSNQLTATGRSVQSILQGRETPVDTASAYSAVPDLDSDDCTMDTCCVWKHIADEMYTKFRGESGRCTKYARAAVRLGFHDAASWSKSTGTGGGADGSILLGNELIRAEHDGLQDVGIVIKKWYDKYHRDYGVGMADLIQMGSNVATVTCPLGPRVRTYVGRPDSTKPAPSGLMPDPNDSADKLIELFRNKTITPDGLIALIGAHTTSQQHFFNQNRDGAPQDSTPGVWDINFYGETKGNAPKRVLKLPSDIALSKNPATAAIWDAFASRVGQEAWNLAYAREYIRLSLLGVYNINDLTECTKVLPMPVTSFSPPDQDAVNQWL